MNNRFNNDYQYDSCVSRGICSISPRISALQTVLVLYFRLFAKYAFDLYEKNLLEDRMKEFVLNSISATIYNSEFNEETYFSIINVFKEKLPEMIQKFVEIFPDNDLSEELKKAKELFSETSDILKAIQFGEKRIVKVQNELPNDIRDLYNIALLIIKSLAINLLDLESYKQVHTLGFEKIITLLGMINLQEYSEKTLKKEIFDASTINVEIMRDIRIIQEKRYGKQYTTEVSYSTKSGKAILVIGSNIRELEIILEELKGEEIDVYTHDEMMLAHTFPKFKEYPNLKGQYGQGMENCLLDFSTFPGPIILTKHSLHNIENFYRGRLFTTDYTCPKGVIRILNRDFSEVIESAKTSKGFKNGKQCESIEIGFNFEETVNIIAEKIRSENYNNVVIIGLDSFSIEQKNYFYKLCKNLPEKSLIISFSYEIERKNLFHINTCFDSYSIIRVYEEIKKSDIPISIFIPRCDRNSISEMIYLSKDKNTKIFVGKCFPIMLNPSLMNMLQKLYSVNNITTIKDDINKILDNTEIV